MAWATRRRLVNVKVSEITARHPSVPKLIVIDLLPGDSAKTDPRCIPLAARQNRHPTFGGIQFLPRPAIIHEKKLIFVDFPRFLYPSKKNGFTAG
jgi:hypothetical protein